MAASPFNTARGRSANFTEMEHELIVDLVEKYAGILENKKTDTATNNEKNECWTRLTDEFNALSGTVYRSSKSIQMKYQNMKKTMRLNYSLEKKQLATSGEQSLAPSPVTAIDRRLKNLINSIFNGYSESAAMYDEDYEADGDSSHFMTQFEEEEGINTRDLVNAEIVTVMDQIEKKPCVLPSDFASNSTFKSNSSSLEMHSAIVQKRHPSKLSYPSSVAFQTTRVPRSKGSSSDSLSGDEKRTRLLSSSTSGPSARRRVYDDLSRWATEKSNLIDLRKKAFLEQTKLERDLYEQEHLQKIKYEKKIYEAQLQEIQERIAQTRERHLIEMQLLKRNNLDQSDSIER